METIRGFKNGIRISDGIKCKEFEFKVGKTYKHIGEIELCVKGFHFHRNSFDLFIYYEMNKDVAIVEIEASGIILDKEDKSVCSEIKIVKILSEEEVSILGNMANNLGWCNTGHMNTGDRNTGHRNTGDSNTGDRNTGDRNTGDMNTGDRNTGGRNTGGRNTGHRNTGHMNTGGMNTGGRNTGHMNTGDRNTGDRNTGHWNKTNRSSGYFNTIEKINVFNKPCSYSTWIKADIPSFLYFNKKWNEILDELTIDEIKKLECLPNFDNNIFREISGYSVGELYRYEILFRNFKDSL
jgi:hypothetical protein